MRGNVGSSCRAIRAGRAQPDNNSANRMSRLQFHCRECRVSITPKKANAT
jgi:hypothetical protein